MLSNKTRNEIEVNLNCCGLLNNTNDPVAIKTFQMDYNRCTAVSPRAGQHLTPALLSLAFPGSPTRGNLLGDLGPGSQGRLLRHSGSRAVILTPPSCTKFREKPRLGTSLYALRPAEDQARLSGEGIPCTPGPLACAMLSWLGLWCAKGDGSAPLKPRCSDREGSFTVGLYHPLQMCKDNTTKGHVPSCPKCGETMLKHSDEALKILGGVGLFFSFTEVSPPARGGVGGDPR